MHPSELALGDGAYIHTKQIITKAPANHTHTRLQRLLNKLIDGVRARIEHTVRRVKMGHKLFHEAWRGNADHLADLVKISVHIQAYAIRQDTLAGNPKYPGFGWWAHW